MAEPEFFDDFFRRKNKEGAWEIVNAPKLFVPVADSHLHAHKLVNPSLSMARAGLHNVSFLQLVTDPVKDGTVVFDSMDAWGRQAAINIKHLGGCATCTFSVFMPLMRVAVGVHPDNAGLFDAAAEVQLAGLLHDKRVSAVGEIGLDYYHERASREVQQDVFRRQVQLAKEAGLPVVLHLREKGDSLRVSDAHDDAFRILQEEGFPEAGVLLHCYARGPEELQRWIDAGCYVSFGGALTRSANEHVRDAARTAPLDRVLVETDAPYQTPEPFRGQKCGPEHVVFTAAELCKVRGCETKDQRDELLAVVYENTMRLLHRDPTAWQLSSHFD